MNEQMNSILAHMKLTIFIQQTSNKLLNFEFDEPGSRELLLLLLLVPVLLVLLSRAFFLFIGSRRRGFAMGLGNHFLDPTQCDPLWHLFRSTCQRRRASVFAICQTSGENESGCEGVQDHWDCRELCPRVSRLFTSTPPGEKLVTPVFVFSLAFASNELQVEKWRIGRLSTYLLFPDSLMTLRDWAPMTFIVLFLFLSNTFLWLDADHARLCVRRLFRSR